MSNYEKVESELASLRSEMEETLAGLVRIDSQQTEALEGMPFGKGVHDAFVFIMDKAKADGFRTFDADGFGGHLEAGDPASDKTLGILAHLDVVPEGDGWTHPPFGAEIVDGKMYGRGTGDDKGPAVAAYYALKAIKRAGIELPIKVRLILGLDEETDWKGMEVYLDQAGPVDFGFTPDADFPVISSEKGIMMVEFAKKFGRSTGSGFELRKISGGQAGNMVADKARAVIYSRDGKDYEEIKEKVEAFNQDHTCKDGSKKLSCRGVGKSFEVSAVGTSAHGATPEKGDNAISSLMDFLGRLTFNNDDMMEFIQFYNDRIGYDLTGSGFGIDGEGDHSGKLTVNVGTIELNAKDVLMMVNIRYPVLDDPDFIYDRLNKVTAEYNLGIIDAGHQLPLNIPVDSPLVKTLMEVYRRRTGDHDAQPVSTGGGTYARSMDNVVAFGMLFPGEEELFHQKDEFVLLDHLYLGAQIYADAILSLCDMTLADEVDNEGDEN